MYGTTEEHSRVRLDERIGRLEDVHRSWAELDGVAGSNRLLLDLESFLDPSVAIDDTDPLFETWYEMRRVVMTHPAPRRVDRAFRSGLLRNTIEQHTLDLGRKLGVDAIVDRRYAPELRSILDGDSASCTPVRLSCRWGGGGVGMRASARGWHRRLLSRFTEPRSSGRNSTTVFPPILNRAFTRKISSTSTLDDESIRIGSGWVETASGRRRTRGELVTTVLGHSDRDRRIEVRLVSIDRTIRLRFDSIMEDRFTSFWTRWNAS